jgi:PKD repeat protein
VDGQYLDFVQKVKNWNGKVMFRLKVYDAGGDDVRGSADDLFNRTNMFNVTVRQVNDPIILVGLGDKTVGVDQLVWFVDEGQWLNISIVTEDVDNLFETVQPPRFSFNKSRPSLKVDQAERMVTFLPRNKDVGTVLENLTVTDGYGSYAYAHMVFHVSNVNNPPKLQGIKDRKVKEDSYLNFTVSARDEDLEIGIENYLVFSTNVTDGVGDDDLPNFGFDVDVDDATRIKVWFLPTNEDVGVIFVEFRVTDGFGAAGEWQDVRTMKITVVNTNDAPVLLEVNGVNTADLEEFPLTATEDEELTVSFDAMDDDSDPLVYYVDDSRFRLSQPGGGNQATITFTPTDDDVGNLMLTVSVWDVYNTYDDLVLNITVMNVNDPPVLVLFEAYDVTGLDQLEFTLYEDVLFTAPIRVADVDSVTISFSDSGGIFGYDMSGDPMTAIANFTPVQADIGHLTTVLEVDDGNGGVDTITIVLDIVGTNDAPEEPTVTQLAFDSLTIPLRATLVSDPDGDNLTYTWDFGDHSPLQSGDDLTDVSHDYPRAGTYQLVLRVTDGNGGESTATYDVLVPETGEEPPETEVQQGPVWLVAVLIAVFAVMVMVMLTLYWKLPRENGDDR